MYWVSLERLRKMNYCNGVDNFINYTQFNTKNISGCDNIRYPCKRCKNKNFLDPDVVMMYLLYKNIKEKYLCWFAHGEPYVPYKIMIEKMIMLTSSSNNVYGVIDDNSNRYRNMIINVMTMNQNDINECSIVDEKPNVYTTIFLVFWKILRYHYKMDAQIIVNYQSLYMCSPSSQIMGWVRLITIKSSNMRKDFYLEGLRWKTASMLPNPWWNPLA